MAWLDELAAKVRGDERWDAATREQVTAFLETQRGFLEVAGPNLLMELIAARTRGDVVSAVKVIGGMDPVQLAAYMDTLLVDMDAAWARREAARQAVENFQIALGQLAFGVLGRVVMGGV
jgi:hypothetical protein